MTQYNSWIFFFTHEDGHISHVESNVFVDKFKAAQQDLDIREVYVFSQTLPITQPHYHAMFQRSENNLWDIVP